MNKKRLLKLADLLEADAKNRRGIKFDLSTWGETPNIAAFTEPSCNTTACAIGLACVSGVFKRGGLSFKVNEEGSIIPILESTVTNYWGEETSTLEEFDAVDQFFDLEDRESTFLFSEEEYPRAKRKGAEGERFVAKRIRDFVAGKVHP